MKPCASPAQGFFFCITTFKYSHVTWICEKRDVVPLAVFAGERRPPVKYSISLITWHDNPIRLSTFVVWRGTAVRDGKSVDVSLDFEGNVVAR